jgi:hypothetical protein
MAQAMKSTGDKPPLEKSTIKKAHDIAKSVMSKEDTMDETMTRQHFQLFADTISDRTSGNYPEIFPTCR